MNVSDHAGSNMPMQKNLEILMVLLHHDSEKRCMSELILDFQIKQQLFTILCKFANISGHTEEGHK